MLADRPGNPARFLLLGSASPTLVRGVSESLAGRTSFVDMGGFDLSEVGSGALDSRWLRGGFPRSWLAPGDDASLQWRKSFIRTFLERDVPQLGISIPAATLSRFWIMSAHNHGQLWNGSVLARSLGVSEKTAKRYLEILEGTFLTRTLLPWFENVGKRLVKAPKVFVRDTGLLHALLDIDNMDALFSHPKVGLSWEGFAIEEIIAQYPEGQPYFYATHGGAELDLLLLYKGKRYGFEMKMNQAPTFSRSMGIALADLKLDGLFAIYPGSKAYPLGESAQALLLTQLPSL